MDAKKQKLNPENFEKKFESFQFEKILNDIPDKKLMVVLGTFKGSEDKAIVTMEKLPFTEESVTQFLSPGSDTSVILSNNIYSTHHLHPARYSDAMKSTLIYPATQKHIDKYTAQESLLLRETAEDYRDITLPYITESQFDIQWIFNILEKKSESERIVFEDPDPLTGFILLPDMKWDGKQMENLYLSAIVHRKGIKSLRDLTTEHLPLLENILQSGQKAILEKYDVTAHHLRVYLHYQPSYYHLHVHFTHLRHEAPGSGVERAHLLCDVIDNIRLSGEYYRQKTLSFPAQRNSGLTQAFLKARGMD